MKKAVLMFLVVAWLASGVLWYLTANYTPNEPVYKLQRRPAAELNAIAENMLKRMEADYEISR